MAYKFNITTPYYLGGHLAARRKARQMTQTQLAQAAECSRRTIIQLEQGANVSTHTMFRVLASLGLAMKISETGGLAELREIQRLVSEED